jgi:hypothetical protein
MPDPMEARRGASRRAYGSKVPPNLCAPARPCRATCSAHKQSYNRASMAQSHARPGPRSHMRDPAFAHRHRGPRLYQ